MNDLDAVLRLSEKIPGWTRAEEAVALARLAHGLAPDAVIVEIGSFFGSGAVLLAGACKLRGSGKVPGEAKVHCVDPFDGSGDAFSVPHYSAIIANYGTRPLRELFDENIRDAGLSEWVVTHQGRAEAVAAEWSTPIDLLFLDGDQSPVGARSAFEAWAPWLRPGGMIALHNSNPRHYDAEHDGNYRLVLEEIQPPRYVDQQVVGSITFGRRASGSE
jgi:predicted O-methyltransferase YrrM